MPRGRKPKPGKELMGFFGRHGGELWRCDHCQNNVWMGRLAAEASDKVCEFCNRKMRDVTPGREPAPEPAPKRRVVVVRRKKPAPPVTIQKRRVVVVRRK